MAQNYFDKGEFDKAATLFEEIVKKQSGNSFFVQKLAACYQQLEQFPKAEQLLTEKYNKYNLPVYLVELGYNFQLQKNQSKADNYYQRAFKEIEKNANYTYSIAQAFEQKTLLPWAYKSYEAGQKANPNMNFDYQMALLQGQMGNLDVMVVKLLDYAYSNPNAVVNVQNQLSYFLQEDTEGNFLASLKKDLLVRTQKNQDIFWNQFLSWLYIQQKEYSKAFIQEKAIYKRNPESFEDIIQLAQLCINDNDNETANSIFQFIIDNTSDEETILISNYYILKNQIEKAKPEEYPIIQQKLNSLLTQFGASPYALDLKLLSAQFYTFQLNQFPQSKAILDELLEKPLNIRQKAKVKMEYGDVLVYDEKFNQAIIYYAQIENDLPNDEMAHEATFKMAKTSFYKKDFDWAMKQAKEMKQASSLLIANDAVELFLLISDNAVEDSLKVALQDFSKAELLEYQNKPNEALKAFLQILEKHKGNSIEPGTLYRIARNYEKLGDYKNAVTYYQQILDLHKDSFYTDEALFFSAESYRKQLNDSEKAKSYYEKVVLEHPDSIYFTAARIQFRTLRGDKQAGI
ncbi:Tetratricopeptide repeat domain protein precursor [Flavobacterium indicum GPTSA100-9 = DSM 17447]|uniref:Tetratricopeptide repeat domain protein n=1 Tax=Flavobacterium indicum (strain DSM 17447 / CIP 109464 / GPTSA100-9) TaxID=1094466 RepID=H8XNI6_FLAIG|nr:Tetratricopeptide repeat domain protein precursor [Flavobacterium indicum GPTSA100-9 = DSM 17447]